MYREATAQRITILNYFSRNLLDLTISFIHNSQLTTHNSQLTTHNSQLKTQNSQLSTLNSKLRSPKKQNGTNGFNNNL